MPMTSFLHVLAGKHIAVMVVVALIGLISLSSSTPRVSELIAAPMVTSELSSVGALNHTGANTVSAIC